LKIDKFFAGLCPEAPNCVGAQIPNCQTGGEYCHANDRRADQVEAAVGWRLPPQIQKIPHWGDAP
jgi:hypothetical protein